MAKVKNLLDKAKEIIYPVTLASAVYMPNGVDTVERIINDMRGQGKKVEFASNGDITIAYASKNVETIQFKVGATSHLNYIIDRVKNENGVQIAYQRTKFNADGSIETTIEESEESEDLV